MSSKSEHTRAQILSRALTLFREQGFEATSMRDIARAAGLSLGAAYYYFEAKEALVAAYYDQVQEAHERAVAVALAGVSGVGPRLAVLYATKLDLIAEDRRFLGALFRFAGDPDHPLSVFAPATAAIRERSIRLHARALEGTALAPGLDGPLARGLWMAHLALLLSALHDRTPGLARTRALASLLADLADRLVSLSALPFAGALLGELLERLAAIEAMGREQPSNPTTQQNPTQGADHEPTDPEP